MYLTLSVLAGGLVYLVPVIAGSDFDDHCMSAMCLQRSRWPLSGGPNPNSNLVGSNRCFVTLWLARDGRIVMISSVLGTWPRVACFRDRWQEVGPRDYLGEDCRSSKFRTRRPTLGAQTAASSLWTLNSHLLSPTLGRYRVSFSSHIGTRAPGHAIGVGSWSVNNLPQYCSSTPTITTSK